jgi:dynein heavy chain
MTQQSRALPTQGRTNSSPQTLPQVVSACMVLTATGGRIPKDLSWAAGKKYMGNVDAFLKSLLSFDRDNVPVNCVDAVERDYISNPGFTPDNIKSKSSAAAGLSAWVINIAKYFRIYQVRPRAQALSPAAGRKVTKSRRGGPQAPQL